MPSPLISTGSIAAPRRALLGGRETMILLLAAVGAGVDAVVLVTFGVLTAAQTGNTVLLGVALGQARWSTGLAAGISVVAYVVGSGIGELVADGGRGRRGGPPLVVRALIIEVLLLIVLLVTWRMTGENIGLAVQDALVALAAVAMGIQSAVTLRLHAGPATTYVTGTLTTFTTEMIRWSRWRALERGPAAARPDAAGGSATEKPRPAMYGLTWGAYLAGAVATAVLGLRVREAALLLPIVILVAVVVTASVSSIERSSLGADPPRRG